MQADSLPAEPPGKPKITGVGSLSLLQGNLPNPGVEPRSPALQADALLTEIPGKPKDQWFNSMKKAMEERDCVGKNPLIVTMDWIWGLRKKKTSTIIDHQTIIMVCGWCDWVGRGFLEELGLLSRDPYWVVV